VKNGLISCSWLHLLKVWSLLKTRGDSCDVLDVLSSGIAKSAANEPKFEPQHLAKEVPAEPRRQLLTEKMLADRWVCSVARLQLVDVNYPDRSATTILAGGSGE
jgi:hypothetical protein